MSWMQRFLEKFREILKLRASDGDLSQEDLDQAMRQARAHVGGMASGEKKRLEREAAAEASRMNEWRLFSQLSLSEDGKSGQVQIFPACGTYSHPRYGKLEITPAFLTQVKANFDAKIYQQTLPLTIDLEHESKLSGAAGWIESVEIKGKDGMWAKVGFNERGQSLVGVDSYRYFSPEFYDSWQDPATNKQYEDVLIGGALTNRPFFKGMAPVAMMTEGVFAFIEAAEDGAPEDDIPAEDQKVLDQLDEYLGALTSFEDDELTELTPSVLDGLLEAVDGFIDSAKASEGQQFAGGHASHGGKHSSHGGGMGPIAKKAARKRVLGKLEGDRAGLLKDISKMRTMKLTSPMGETLRRESIKGAQTQLAAVRKKMVAARAKYRTESGQFAEKAGGRMMGMMADMMAKMKAMLQKMQKGEMPADDDMEEMSEMVGKMESGKKTPEMMRASLMEAGLSEDDASIVLGELGLATKNGMEEPMGMSEEEARQFAEMGNSLKSLSERLASETEARKAAEADAKAASERVAAIERADRRRQLSEFVRDNRHAFEGEVGICVDRLDRLATKLDETEFADYLSERKALAGRVKASEAFVQVSRPGPGNGTAASEFDAARRKLMSEQKLDEHEAAAAVAASDPALYARFDREFKNRIKRGGE